MSVLTLTKMLLNCLWQSYECFIYGNAQIDERFLNRDKWGTEKLTLTLLIGIKADLPQFILYPDRLLKWSNSLITLETETSKWSKYRIISSAYNEILWLWSWILIDTSDFLMACAKGSRDRQNNKGESGHPCLVPRCKGNEGEIILPVMTDAAGEWYNVLIIETKVFTEAETLQNYPHIIPL